MHDYIYVFYRIILIAIMYLSSHKSRYLAGWHLSKLPSVTFCVTAKFRSTNANYVIKFYCVGCVDVIIYIYIALYQII